MEQLPSNFLNRLVVLQNYSKQCVRVLPITGATVQAGGFTSFQLPIGSVLDLRTLYVSFFGRTMQADGTDIPANTNICGFPAHTACLIKNLSININGTNIQNIPHYSWLYKLLTDYKTSYNNKLKQVNTNPDPSFRYELAANGAVTKYNTFAPTDSAHVNSFKRNYVINEWIGFLGTCEPSIINTNLLGQVEIVIEWENNGILWQQIAGAGAVLPDPNYELSNIELWVDKLDFMDERYMTILNQEVSTENGMKIPYKNYMVYLGPETANSKNATVKITENCRSLEKIIYSFMPTVRNNQLPLQLGTPANVLANLAVGADAPAIVTFVNDTLNLGHLPKRLYCYQNLVANADANILNTSAAFSRSGLGLGVPVNQRAATNCIEFFINSQSVAQLSFEKAYEETIKAFDLHDDDIKHINPGLRDIVTWEKDFFAAALSTSHIGNKDPNLGYLMSGRNTLATSMNIVVTSQNQRGTNNAQAAKSVLVTEFSSTLLVKTGRNVAFIR